MSSDLIKNNAVCNYAILSRYNGAARLPLTLNNISVPYPVDPSFQAIPVFAGTAYYTAPDYNTLVKGSCYNYAGINQAYIDCSDPASSRGCNLTNGQCVTYMPRACDLAQPVGQPSFVVNDLGQCNANYLLPPDMMASPPRYPSVAQCMANAGSKAGTPYGPVAQRNLPGQTAAPSITPTMSVRPSPTASFVPSTSPAARRM